LFLEELDRISKIFRSIIEEKRLKLVCHHDADGLCSASILVKMLLRENVNFELRIVKQLTIKDIKNLDVNEDDILVLADLGSGQLNFLKDVMERTQILVLDHHEPQKIKSLNLFHLNPMLYGESISSSMICYLFAKSLNLKNTDLIDLAIIGAVGDKFDENWELKGEISKKILKEAETISKITILKGLRLYGRFERPIHKTLEYSFDPFIPGISGSESNSIQFLSELGLKLKEHGEWRKLKDLSLDEQQKLASAIIIERLRAKRSDAINIFGEIYSINGRPEELQDAREFATLLNACGRLRRHDVAIRLCLNDLTAIEISKEILSEYRRIISESIGWIRERDDAVLTTDFATYLFCEDEVPDTIIGTITSIFLNSNLVDTNKPIFGFANTDDNMVKISTRASRNLDINLRNIIVKAVDKFGTEGGGHEKAAGALIPKGKEKEFANIVDNILSGLHGKKS